MQPEILTDNVRTIAYSVDMDLPVSTFALLFPAVSLLFLSYTNRFLHLSALIRKLHTDWLGDHDQLIISQIMNLRTRLRLIRLMQFLGALSLLSSVTGMLVRILGSAEIAGGLLVAALGMMVASLLCLAVEIGMSGRALNLVLNALEQDLEQEKREKKQK